MFIRLTKKDGTPVWLNPEYIVTVEPLKSVGAVVVPVGDGLDYEVRESAEAIISLIEGEPFSETPAAPAESAAKDTPAEKTEEPVASEPVAAEPVFEGAAVPDVTEAEAAAAVAAVVQLSPKPEEPKPTKRARKAKTRPAPAGTPATEGERKAPRRRAVRKTPLDLTEEQLVRLRGMAPRSVKRLSNTLKSQFSVVDPEATVRALVEHDILTIDDQSHITWIYDTNA